MILNDRKQSYGALREPSTTLPKKISGQVDTAVSGIKKISGKAADSILETCALSNICTSADNAYCGNFNFCKYNNGGCEANNFCYHDNSGGCAYTDYCYYVDNFTCLHQSQDICSAATGDSYCASDSCGSPAIDSCGATDFCTPINASDSGCALNSDSGGYGHSRSGCTNVVSDMQNNDGCADPSVNDYISCPGDICGGSIGDSCVSTDLCASDTSNQCPFD